MELNFIEQDERGNEIYNADGIEPLTGYEFANENFVVADDARIYEPDGTKVNECDQFGAACRNALESSRVGEI